ncbi:MAG: division/cell wall cluster transcriptional repressor MraZ [Candidatus Doudnabacteria bacterium]|nr:division/cell wall cluster transcriptional repressor MraZ [Candidatus Doudnabacteria bacterium]
MFIGEYSLTVDEKGRLSIPVKFRASLSRGAVVTRGLDSALFLYTAKEWEILAGKLANLPISRANTRAFSRLMLAGAMDVEMDKQGRIILPDYLRDFAGIKKKKVTVAGLYNRLEIWDEEKWTKYKTSTERTSGDIAEALEQIV